MRVALVHDWLTGMRGGERVLEQMCALFPEADLFTLFHHKGSVSSGIEGMRIRTSFLDRLPAIHRNYRYLLPLYPWAISSLDLNGYDLILSSSHAVAKSVRKPRGSLHICYCHTPMRYIWDAQADYFQYGDPLRLRRTALRALTTPLRSWDRRTAHRVDCFIANSRHVQERIARCYNRPATVIYPPVDTAFFSPSQNGHGRGFYLVVSALVSSKRLDLAVGAFNQLGRPLLIAGSGPDLARLRTRAARNVHFQGFVSDEELRELYWSCRAVVIPGREDFGIVSLEAQACGRPVVAFAAGGSLESVKDGETGILFRLQNAEDLAEAIRRAEDTSFDPAKLRQNAERFSSEQFREALQLAIRDCGLRISDCGLKEGTNKSTIRNPKSEIRNPKSSRTRHSSLAGMRGVAKRTIDVLLAISGLAFLGLPLLLTALLIRLTSSGSGYFFQKRVGLGGRSFRMAKLRTMHRNAEKEDVPIWAVDCDPRCAPLGNLLRRYGIDELPQLWNVLKGEMSFVGPRPERPEFHRLFSERDPRFGRRLEVRGGLTGLAQIRGWRGNTSVDERLKSDLEYVDTWSLSMDLLILLQTPLALWRGKQQTSAAPPEITKTDV
jgi:lipopolysaccharide/colanic/teichoic acid biosynthesis glycosyltransferase/glycosyltransferase involved in cell wall biosynthesis